MFALALTQLGSYAGETFDHTLVPSIFAPESAPAHSISHLAAFVLVITGIIFVIVAGLLVYAVVRFRRRAGDDDMEPAQIYGSGPVEAAWTIVPFLIVVVFALTTARVIQELQDAREPETALDVQVIGHQWWWEFRYPKLGIVTANELHVPASEGKGRLPTFLDLRSADVVHSFWVPRLAGKTDLIPNKINSMWIEPERAGLFLGQCGTYCGTQHAKMLLRVYADMPEEFDRWVQKQKETAENDRSGGRAEGFRADGLHQLPCHWGHGCGRPIWAGPDAFDEPRHAGLRRAENSPENLRAWIKSPDSSNREY